MALIGKIRQNFWFVLIVLGFALAAFVIMDMTSANRGNVMNPTIGTINGTKINAQEFTRAESVLSQNTQVQDANVRRENLWNYYVDKSIVEEEVEDLGLNVPSQELMDLQFGQNLSPVIQQTFFNPQTGQIDRQQLSQIQNAIITNNGLTPDFRAFWSVTENQVIAAQLENKLNNLVSKSIYTPTWMLEQEYKQNNTRAQVAYVKVPFDAIADDAVEVSDSDIKNYMNENKEAYSNEVETRIIEYVSFPVSATSKDSSAIYNDMLERTRELANSETDSIYAVNNGGDMPIKYEFVEDLPEQLQDSVGLKEVGDPIGPFLYNGVYSSAKVVGKQVVPDSVEARVIFRQAAATTPALVESAQALLDSLQNLVETGQADFDSLAIANSQDPTSTNGGDLGYLVQGQLPAPLDNLLFLEGNGRGMYQVSSPQGLTLIQITDVIRRTREDRYRLAYINARVVPSQETQDSILDIVNDFLSDNRTSDKMLEEAKSMNKSIRTSVPLLENDYRVGTLPSSQSSRDMVRWAFDPSAEVGDVAADFYSFTDPIDYFTNEYVVISLNDIVPSGMQRVESVRDQLMPLVRNMKKGEKIKSEISSSDLAAIASKYSTTVDTLSAVTMASSSIPELGNEPQVVASIFSAGENTVSEPIVGNSGVYLVKPLEIAEPGQAANLGSSRRSSLLQARSKVSQGLLEGLRKKADIDDGRFGYGF